MESAEEQPFVDFIECKCGQRYTTQQSESCPNCGSTSVEDRVISVRVHIKEGFFSRLKKRFAERGNPKQ